jgi:hypothetical protein
MAEASSSIHVRRAPRTLNTTGGHILQYLDHGGLESANTAKTPLQAVVGVICDCLCELTPEG